MTNTRVEDANITKNEDTDITKNEDTIITEVEDALNTENTTTTKNILENPNNFFLIENVLIYELIYKKENSMRKSEGAKSD